jgi:hypothetical protein
MAAAVRFDTTYTPPATFTERSDFNTGGQNVALGVFDKGYTTTTATGTITAVSGVSDYWAAYIIAVPEPGTAATDRKDVWGAMPI